MTETHVIREHVPSFGEEIANSLSHGVGLTLAIAGTPILIIAAVRYGSAWNTVGVSVFAASMISLYLASTLYHALTHDKAKRFFRVLDHGAIFILIAGTYTPFTLVVIRGPLGWTLFGLDRSAASSATRSINRPRMAARGRRSLYRRRRVLRGPSHSLRALRLASLRDRRNSLSFLRSALVFGVTSFPSRWNYSFTSAIIAPLDV